MPSRPQSRPRIRGLQRLIGLAAVCLVGCSISASLDPDYRAEKVTVTTEQQGLAVGSGGSPTGLDVQPPGSPALVVTASGGAGTSPLLRDGDLPAQGTVDETLGISLVRGFQDGWELGGTARAGQGTTASSWIRHAADPPDATSVVRGGSVWARRSPEDGRLAFLLEVNAVQLQVDSRVVETIELQEGSQVSADTDIGPWERTTDVDFGAQHGLALQFRPQPATRLWAGAKLGFVPAAIASLEQTTECEWTVDEGDTYSCETTSDGGDGTTWVATFTPMAGVSHHGDIFAVALQGWVVLARYGQWLPPQLGARISVGLALPGR